MFTGIIEETGKIKNVKKGIKSCIIEIEASEVIEDVKIGDSIAVNGVCLTVTKLTENGFTADVMAETMRETSLSVAKNGTYVNLERAMKMNGRFGGHIVSGHIDGIGTIVGKTKEDNAVWFDIKTKPEVMKYIADNGSVAVDGISLTVAKVSDDSFSVSVIPHTRSKTIILNKNKGDIVNIETDMLFRYIEKLMNYKNKDKKMKNQSAITIDYLIENGF